MHHRNSVPVCFWHEWLQRLVMPELCTGSLTRKWPSLGHDISSNKSVTYCYYCLTCRLLLPQSLFNHNHFPVFSCAWNMCIQDYFPQETAACVFSAGFSFCISGTYIFFTKPYFVWLCLYSIVFTAPLTSLPSANFINYLLLHHVWLINMKEYVV